MKRLDVKRRTPRIHRAVFRVRTLFSEEFLALILVLLVFTVPAAATTRFENRGLFMTSTEPGVTTSYTVSLSYMTPEPVGSLDMLFCISPIPYDPCEVPPGLDASQATLIDQSGETGFSIHSKSVNHIVLSRPSSMIMSSNSASSYVFDNIKNPTDIDKSFSIRLKSHSSMDATGSQIDFGSVKGQVSRGIGLETQVPPMLIFCAAQQVESDCSATNEIYYSDMGTLDENETLTTQSQLAIGTNATGGFVITANGGTLAAGTNTIDNVTSPTESIPGKNQFGINLVENSTLGVGRNPEGEWANAVPTDDYGQSNKYMYVPGDVIAHSPHVSLMRKFTVSYIVNTAPSLRAGIYTTTINYIASGRF